MLRFIAIGNYFDQLIQAFQYISCYGLSKRKNQQCFLHSNFNTSHVTVYLMFYLLFFFMRYNFNTSHVTVYLHGNGRMEYRTKFQYISCYGLSPCCIGKNQLKYISIHLMLRFICVCDRARVHVIQISIHLMLRFIIKKCL